MYMHNSFVSMLKKLSTLFIRWMERRLSKISKNIGDEIAPDLDEAINEMWEEIADAQPNAKPGIPIFLSKSSRLEEASNFRRCLDEFLKNEYHVFDDSFRVFFYTNSPTEKWQDQFHHMLKARCVVAVYDPQNILSDAQENELDYLLGFGLPIAFCRIVPFEDKQANECFLRSELFGAWPKKFSDRHTIANFDFSANTEFDTEQLEKLKQWIASCAIPTVKIPIYFSPNIPQNFSFKIQPHKSSSARTEYWEHNKIPMLVLNYGPRFGHDLYCNRLPNMISDQRQILVPLHLDKESGNLEGEICLPVPGSGHGVVTNGPIRASYAEEDELRCFDPKEWYLWWDFFCE